MMEETKMSFVKVALGSVLKDMFDVDPYLDGRLKIGTRGNDQNFEEKTSSRTGKWPSCTWWPMR